MAIKELIEYQEELKNNELGNFLDKGITYLGHDKVIYEFDNSERDSYLKIFYDGRVNMHNEIENKRINTTIETFLKNNTKGQIEIQLVDFNLDEKNKSLKRILQNIKKTKKEMEKENK